MVVKISEERKPKNYKGKVFGKLTVLRRKNPLDSKDVWLCKCSCGTEKVYFSGEALDPEYGGMTHCGCEGEVASSETKSTDSIFYKRAIGILQRCNDPSHRQYKDYGGRGVRCLLGTTPAEVAAALKLVPDFIDGFTIDRIDHDGNYTLTHPEHGDNIWLDSDGRQCRGNLRWLSPRNQSLNRSNNIGLENLATVPRFKSNAVKYIKSQGWDPKHFDAIDVGNDRWLFSVKEEYKDRVKEKQESVEED